ncbi:MAG: TonB-dependent receptor [Melioribacteraceae bacterium]|nr:TonB-dependent receptor [Melioribacteraceae bacterium]
MIKFSREISLLFFLLAANLTGQSNTLTGTIKGRLIDKDSKSALIGANVIVVNTTIGTSTDTEGNFELIGIPVGSYSMKFSYIGYSKVIKTDIIVRPGRITFIDGELVSSSIKTDSIVVTGGYFTDSEIQPNSITGFSSEEVRRAPGSGGDVSRIMLSLPSVAKINDQSNSLIVRGGSPIENIFYIDNIEIPNINHFPMVGSSGGPIGILNVDFIKNVTFYSGGFSTVFGNRLSSVMDIKLRDGNRDEFDAQLDISFQSIGGIIEGPLHDGSGSWFLSARKSYLDLIFESVAPGEAMPDYSDSHFKLAYNLSKNHKISFLNIFSRDRQNMNYKKAIENFKDNYFDIKVDMNTAGINWQYLWDKSGYSNFTISHLYWKDRKDVKETRTRMQRAILNSDEQELRLRNTNHYRINENHKSDFGFDVKYLFNIYDNLYASRVDILGQSFPELHVQTDINYFLISGFMNYMYDTNNNFSLYPGLRLSYTDFNNKFIIEPRFSATYSFNNVTSITASFGIYSQSIPAVFLAQNKQYKSLDNPEAIHYVLSFNHILEEDVKLTLELYDKEYSNLPVDPSRPQLLIFDESIFNISFDGHTGLISKGIASSCGIEMSVQKKLAKNIYGLIAGTYFRSGYRDLNGKWQDRIFDNKFSFTIEGGYKPDNKWEFSMRWIYAGGAPYTPFDIETSKEAYSGVLDQARINGERLPDYHSLNLRVDRRFHFINSSLVIYFSIWNAYGRKNIYAYSWNELKNEPREEMQWTSIPIFGLELEF